MRELLWFRVLWLPYAVSDPFGVVRREPVWVLCRSDCRWRDCTVLCCVSGIHVTISSGTETSVSSSGSDEDAGKFPALTYFFGC